MDIKDSFRTIFYSNASVFLVDLFFSFKGFKTDKYDLSSFKPLVY